jgi:hypothetical protein
MKSPLASAMDNRALTLEMFGLGHQLAAGGLQGFLNIELEHGAIYQALAGHVYLLARVLHPPARP